MKKLFIILLIFVQIGPGWAQINRRGVPFVKNFSKDDYKGAEQIWAICQDNRGVMYFGNLAQGVLEYDGINWTHIPISNNSIIRSLVADSVGTIYVGGVNDFGYLQPNMVGKLEYKSLSAGISESYKDVWKIIILKNEVYFCSSKYIFVYRDKKLVKTHYIDEYGFLSFLVNGKIYWGNYTGGLKVLENESFVDAPGASFFKEKDIFVMLPYEDNKIFIGTYDHGSYLYDIESGKSENIIKINSDFKFLSNLLVESRLYHGIQLNNGNYAFSTLTNGCIIANKDGEIIYHLNKQAGLQDAIVITSFQSKDGLLWLGLNNGISYFEINSPLTKFIPNHGIDGIVTDVIQFKGNLYIASTIGLYYLKNGPNKMPQFYKASLDQVVWMFSIFKTKDGVEKLIIANSQGVYELENPSKIKRFSDSKNLLDARVIYQSKIDPNKLYVGHLRGLTLFEYKNGNFIESGNVADIDNTIESISEDENGDLWLGTSLDGILRVKDNKKAFYGVDKGLPELYANKTLFFNNQIIVATYNGVYSYDKTSDKFIKSDIFGKVFFERNDIVDQLFKENDSTCWIISKNYKKNIKEKHEYIEKVLIRGDKSVEIIDLPFKRLKNHNCQRISFESDSGIWFSSATEAIFYNPLVQNTNDFYYISLVRKVNIVVDSVLFWGTNFTDTSNYTISVKQPASLKTTQKYKYNNITFYYSSPYFPIDDMKYSYKLEGFEDDWSNWDNKTYKDYTNLDEGKYVFKIKAQNIYGIESEIAEYEFSVLPPWYRTFWALLLYILAAIGVIAITVKLYTRKLQLEKIRLEQIVKERTEEVVKQKDEILQQRDEIAEKNKSITDSIEYAKRIQNAVLPSKDFAKEVLPEHFILFRPRDIVSGDFYWFTKKDNLLIIIAADCTGHGVPGAFMSMLGVSFINEIVNKHEVKQAGEILTHLRADVKRTLSQTGKEGEAKDGMDIALCVVDLDNMKMQYAGAYNPMYLFRNNELIEFKADRMPIGIYIKEKDSFTNNEIPLQKGDVFYIFSDGYEDQFGGEDGQKFKSKNFKILLQEIHQKPMAEQREILNTNIDKWRGKWEQVDDIIVFGVRIP